MTTRTVVKTVNGFRVYGAFTSMMDIDANGKVTYCNMVADSLEYRRMYSAYKKLA